MTKNELLKVRDWAQSKIDAGEEPPWAWYQYMKLIETLDSIVRGMSATKGLTVVGENEEVNLPI